MGYRTNTISSNIEEWVEHLEKMCDLFAQSYNYLSKTEFGGAMHNIKLSIRRLGNVLYHISKEQQSTLLNVTPFKTKKILLAFGHIKSDISIPQSFDVEKREYEDNTNWDELIKLENFDSPFNIGDDYEEYHKTRHFLMSSIRRNYFESIDFISFIIKILTELDEQTEKIESDNATQRELYNKMWENYRKNEWSQDRLDFIEQEKATIYDELKKGKDFFDILKSELRDLRQTHLNSFMPTHVKRLYSTVVNQKRPAYEAIVRYRKKLTVDDISDYFSFLFRYQTLWEHIESIPLLAPLTGKYEKLFTCKAAKEYVDLLTPVLTTYGGLDGKEHYGVLLLVMMDLGLAQTDSKPYRPMMSYANEKLEGTFEEQSMINKTVKPLVNACFRELELGDVGGTNLKVEKIEEYQDVYWRCFTILNQRGLCMPKEMKVASYLNNPHKNINLSVIMEGYRAEILIRLDFLRSVLRRETLVFG